MWFLSNPRVPIGDSSLGMCGDTSPRLRLAVGVFLSVQGGCLNKILSFRRVGWDHAQVWRELTTTGDTVKRWKELLNLVGMAGRRQSQKSLVVHKWWKEWMIDEFNGSVVAVVFQYLYQFVMVILNLSFQWKLIPEYSSIYNPIFSDGHWDR